MPSKRPTEISTIGQEAHIFEPINIKQIAGEIQLLGAQAAMALSDRALNVMAIQSRHQNSDLQLSIRRIQALSADLMEFSEQCIQFQSDEFRLRKSIAKFLYNIFAHVREDRPRPLSVADLPYQERSCLQGVTNFLRELELRLPPELESMPIHDPQELKNLRLG